MKKKRRKILFLCCLLFFCSPVQSSFAQTQWITIKGTNVVVDSFKGVDAIYTQEKNADSDATYSCAAYVKKYYKEIYGVNVTNLMDNGPPMIPAGGASFVQVTKPQIGDIVFWPTSKNKNNHSAIVKAVNGNTVTLIEQNYKSSATATAAVNRTVTFPSAEFEFWRLTGNFQEKAYADKKTNTNITSTNTNAKRGSKDNPEALILDMESIPKLCQAYEKGVISSVTGKQSNMQIETKQSNREQSYILYGSGTYYEFIIDDFEIEGWYLNEKGNWRQIDTEEEIITTKAYFTIPNIRKVALDEPIELDQIIGLPNEIVDNPEQFVSEENSLENPIVEEPIIPQEEELREELSDISFSFSDVDQTHWAYESIQNCVAKGIFTGYEDGTFQPDKKITRAEFAVLICKGMNIDVSSMTEESCADVKKEDWYSPYVEFARFILEGETRADGSIVFRPNDDAKREDACSAVVKMENFDVETADTSILDGFLDKNTISLKRKKEVALAVAGGYISGFEDNTFRGQDAITRAQAAVLFDQISK